MSWRLGIVQRYLEEAFDRHEGPVDVLSLCAGDGRDLLGVLSQRSDAERVRATLIELHPEIVGRAREGARRAGLVNVEIREVDGGESSSYEGSVPADIVLMMGIFGNISDDDLERTIRTAPQLCRAGATLLWSRGRDRDDRNDAVRQWFTGVGFVELDYAERDIGSRPALGAMSYRGSPEALVPGQRLFTFLR